MKSHRVNVSVKELSFAKSTLKLRKALLNLKMIVPWVMAHTLAVRYKVDIFNGR